MLVFSFSFHTAYANIVLPAEVEGVTILKTETMSFLVKTGSKEYFEKIQFNEENNYLSLKTLKKVDLIQIFNETGALEFQLPIQGNQIHISMDDFAKGNYDINLKFENEDTFVTSQMVKK